MICPKCGFKQPDAKECIKCGIVIRKFEAEQEAARAVEKALKEQEPEHRVQEITIFIYGYRIQGQVRLPAKGYRSRLSDFLNDEDFKFIPIINAKVTSIDGELNIPFTDVVVINKNEIAMVIPQ